MGRYGSKSRMRGCVNSGERWEEEMAMKGGSELGVHCSLE